MAPRVSPRPPDRLHSLSRSQRIARWAQPGCECRLTMIGMVLSQNISYNSAGMKEAEMSSRLAIGIGVPICLALMATASQIQAQTAAPSPADIEQQLRPAPKLGPIQGLPYIGVSGPETNPAYHPTSTSPDRAGPASAAGKRSSSGASASHMHASADTHVPSMAFNTIQFAFGSTQLTPESSSTL